MSFDLWKWNLLKLLWGIYILLHLTPALFDEQIKSCKQAVYMQPPAQPNQNIKEGMSKTHLFIFMGFSLYQHICQLNIWIFGRWVVDAYSM